MRKHAIPLIFILQCGNPGLNQYLITKSGESPKSEKPDKIQLYEKDKLKIILETPDAESIDEFADKLSIATQQKYYRLPDLTYFRIRIINNRDSSVKINLFNAVFRSEYGNLYTPLKKSEYQKRFTSIAYERFPYDSMYSFYVTRTGNKKPEGENIFLEKVLPEQTVEISADEEGHQLLPFEFFDPGSRLYSFLLVISQEEKIQRDFFYRTNRNDQKNDLNIRNK